MLQNRRRSQTRRLPKVAKIALLLALCGVQSRAFAETVLSCNDGDTCKVRDGKQSFKVRLSGIDAPESGQEFSTEATMFLEAMVKGKVVTLKCDGVTYDRKACSVFFGKIDVQAALVRAGWALDYPKYSKGKYGAAQLEARKAKRGMWQKADFTSPYCYRWLGTKACNANKQFQP